MGHPRFTAEEIGARARALYEQSIRAKVEAEHRGKYLVIDIETGEYEIGEDYLTLSRELQARHADAALHIIRIGYPTAGRIGGRPIGSRP
jgi:hypothetical protein